MHEGLLVSFEIGAEKVEVPNTAGVKQGDNMAPLLFVFVCRENVEFAAHLPAAPDLVELCFGAVVARLPERSPDCL